MLSLQKGPECVCCSEQALRAHRIVHRWVAVLRMCRKRCTCHVPAAQVLIPAQEILLLFTAPFPSPYTLDLLHKKRTCSVLETPGNVVFAVLRACSRCVPTSGWGPETEVSRSNQGLFWLLWWLFNLGLACSSLCLKLTLSSFKFSSKFGFTFCNSGS